MKLYPVPGGIWAGTEADWKAALKAKGLDHKHFRDSDGKPLTREVPTGKKELIEFLTFFAVDVFRTGGAPTPTTVPAVDVEALRRQHNPEGAEPAPAPAPAEFHGTLEQQFVAAPLKVQAELAVGLIDRLTR